MVQTGFTKQKILSTDPKESEDPRKLTSEDTRVFLVYRFTLPGVYNN